LRFSKGGDLDGLRHEGFPLSHLQLRTTLLVDQSGIGFTGEMRYNGAVFEGKKEIPVKEDL